MSKVVVAAAEMEGERRKMKAPKIMMNKKIHTAVLCAAAFLVSLFILIVLYAALGIYPFGDRSLMIWDMTLQYADFFSWLKRVFSGEADFFYSFSKSLGDGTIGLTSFYLMSPFNLLLFFFDDIQLFIVCITILKLSSASAAAAAFLNVRFPKLSFFWKLLLSCSYGFMTYNFLQASNIMWLDGVIMLPIILIGVYRLVIKKKAGTLFLATALAVLFNWYTAYMCCLFSFFYFCYETILAKRKWVKSFLTYCITMILAVGSTMVFFLPNILNLLGGKGAANPDDFKMRFRCGILDILWGLLPGHSATSGSGETLLLYCGLLTLLCVILYFVSRKIGKREKLLSAVFLIFFVFTAIFVPTENIWNGFRKVSSYYCRFSFGISLFLIYLAASYLKEREVSSFKKWVPAVCFLIGMLDLSYNGKVLTTRFSVNGASQYNEYAKEAMEQVEELKEYDSSTFYRVDQTKSRGTLEENYKGTYNEGMAYGYSPLASYSSTFNKNTVEFYSNCGYSECERLIMYHEPILLSDALLGIKYVFSTEAPEGFLETGLPEKNGKWVYENPYALSLGYGTERKIKNKIEAENSFEYQNKLVSRILGRNVQCFKKAEAEMRIEGDRIIWEVENPDCRNILYGYLTRRGANTVDIYINNEFRTHYSNWISYQTFQIGEGETSGRQTVEMRGDIQRTDGIEGIFYYLDLEVFEEAMEELKSQEMQVEEFRDGYVRGSYHAKEDGYLMLTVPYDEGWTITRNGREVTPGKAADTFLMLKVKQGENEIELRYQVSGMKEGAAVSAVSMVLFGFGSFFWHFSSHSAKMKEKSRKTGRNGR